MRKKVAEKFFYFIFMVPDKPSEVGRSQFQLFQSRLDSQIEMNHPLVILAGLIDWDYFHKMFVSLFSPDKGAPALPVRLMVGLEYLKYAYNLSDEELVERWRENPYWQYFCGESFFQTELPLHPTSLGKWRIRVGAEKLKSLIEETIRIAKSKKFTNDEDLSRVIVDTTVQEKNITHPTDAKLLTRAIIKLGKFSLEHGIKLRQSYTRKAKQMLRKASGYAAAGQYNRLNNCIKTLKNWLGRSLRDIERKREKKVISTNFESLIDISKKLLVQEKNSKKKIYSLHEPDVQCICKGKERKKYEFGNKVSVTTTNARNWVVNVQDLPNNPYDGHTLSVSISGAEKITKVTVVEANVDKGYRGHDYEGEASVMIAGSSNKNLSFSERRRKRRRSAVEPVIGHLKFDHRLDRCFLKGLVGDGLNVIGAAAGFNFRKLLRLLGNGKFSRALTKIALTTLSKLTIKQIWQNFHQTKPILHHKIHANF